MLAGHFIQKQEFMEAAIAALHMHTDRRRSREGGHIYGRAIPLARDPLMR